MGASHNDALAALERLLAAQAAPPAPGTGSLWAAALSQARPPAAPACWEHPPAGAIMPASPPAFRRLQPCVLRA
jgi:hypothetical protein